MRRSSDPPVPCTDPSTRARLLEAAGDEFAAHGFARATVRRICRAARANVAAVSYHFGDKAGLYRAVLHEAFARKEERAPFPPDAAAPLGERVEAFAEAMLRRLLTEGPTWHARIMAWEMVEPTDALRDVVATWIRPVQGRVEELVREARADLAPRARRLHARSLLGQIVFYRHARPCLALLDEDDPARDLPGLARHIAGQFLRGLERPDLVPAARARGRRARAMTEGSP